MDFEIEEALRSFYSEDITMDIVLEISHIINEDFTQTFNRIYKYHLDRPDKLELHYSIKCPQCNSTIKIYNDLSKIDKTTTVHCYSCIKEGYKFNPNSENIHVSFKISEQWRKAINFVKNKDFRFRRSSKISKS